VRNQIFRAGIIGQPTRWEHSSAISGWGLFGVLADTGAGFVKFIDLHPRGRFIVTISAQQVAIQLYSLDN
jgi:hypothetical protein